MVDLQVPWLRKGTGNNPSEGGCILQVIDWIDRNQWTDKPTCVHPVLARLAIKANDTLDDAGRQKLLDLAPRLMGTASNDKVLSVKLAVFCARKVLHLFEDNYPNDDRVRRSIEATEAWIAVPTEANRRKVTEARRAYAAAAAAADAAASTYADAAAAYAAAAAAADAAASTYAAAAAASAASASASADILLFLIDVLDEYDRITDRQTVCPVDLTPAAVAMAGSNIQ